MLRTIPQPTFRRTLPNRLSWPRSGLHGQDYQVCLISGTAFGYDWTTCGAFAYCRTNTFLFAGCVDNQT